MKRSRQAGGEWKRGVSLALRGAERLLPTSLLYWLGYPHAWRAARRARALSAGSWPECLGGEANAPASAWLRPLVSLYANAPLHHLRDRLAHLRWRERCEVSGLARWQEASRRGPVLLAFVHFGPYYECNLWLRAHGVPVTTLMLGTAENRSPVKRYADRYNLFPSVPYVLHTHQLRELVQVLATGGTVMVALDVRAARQHVEIPVGEAGETFHLAAGALRLAARHGATLLPCTIIQRGHWRFRLELGEPVPTGYLTGQNDFPAVGRHLIAQMLPCWRRNPEQCHPMLLECIQPAAAAR